MDMNTALQAAIEALVKAHGTQAVLKASVVERASLHKEAVAEWSLGDQAFRTGRGSAEAHWQRGNDLWMQAKGVTKIEA